MERIRDWWRNRGFKRVEEIETEGKPPVITADSLCNKVWPEYEASLLSRLTFFWLSPLLSLGLKKPIGMEDIWAFHPIDGADQSFKKFEANWKAELGKERPSLATAVFKTWKRAFLTFPILLFPYVFNLLFNPILLRWMIAFVNDSTQPTWVGVAYAFTFLFCGMGAALCYNFFLINMMKTANRARSAMTVAIYQKILLMSSASKQNQGIGSILNFMSNDLDKIIRLFWQGNIGLFANVQIFGLIIVLSFVIGWSAIAGGAVLAILLGSGVLISRRIAKARKELIDVTDTRVKLTNEILKGVRVIKFHAYEEQFREKILGIREIELKKLRRLVILREFNMAISTVTPVMMSLATFGVYSFYNEMTPSVAYTVVALYVSLRLVLKMVPMTFSTYSEAKVGVERLQQFFSSEDIQPSVTKHDLPANVSVKIQGNFAWTSADDRFQLSQVNLEILRGELIGVIGSVGAGKSTLVSSMLRETRCLDGSVSVDGRVAYMPQQAWIFQGTVVDNILFSKPMNKEKYDRVIEECALFPDLEILPAGDLTEIGERGVNLSGGQKQRVSMARCFYDEPDVFLMDDPLSAVDQHVQKHLFDSIKNLKCTRILVTHQLDVLPHVDRIIVMKDGRILHFGSYRELSEKGVDLGELVGKKVVPTVNDQVEDEKSVKIPSSPSPSARTEKSEKGKLVVMEERSTGSVDPKTYQFYFSRFGGSRIFFPLVLLFFAAAQSNKSLADWWLSQWSESQRNLAFNLGIYGGLIGGYAIMVLLRVIFIVSGGITASRQMHATMLKNILDAPLNFFTSTPLGRIMNRFARDMQRVDEETPSTIHSLLEFSFTVFAGLIVISIVSWWSLIMFLPMSVIYYRAQRSYRGTNREVKRLESITKSPIFQNLSETLAGLDTIRAFKMEEALTLKNKASLDYNARPYVLNLTLNRWLSVRLETIANCVLFVAAISAVVQRDTMDPGMLGFGLTYALMITSLLNGMVMWFTDLEIKMNAVERIQYYSDVTREEEALIPLSPPADWICKGEIVFDNLEVRYRLDSEPVLRNFTCKIKSCEKIGIVGRTGAGKSSLLYAIFRMLPFSQGKIEIDGIDISLTSLKDLRSRLSIVPQDPILFSGTIRSNLDLLDEHTDADLWKVLERVQLLQFVRDSPEGLSTPILENGDNLSVGQRQLMCLARALLRQSKIIVLDEATASVDLENDNAIQRTIRRELVGSTVLIIAHRMHTVRDLDRVMVVHQGRIIEFDAPDKLLEDPNSSFSQLYHAHS